MDGFDADQRPHKVYLITLTLSRARFAQSALGTQNYQSGFLNEEISPTTVSEPRPSHVRQTGCATAPEAHRYCMQKKWNSHMKHILLAVLASIFLVFAPGKIMADSAEIEITAGYRERIALPPDAILEVELLDVSRADAPSIRLSSQRFKMDRVPLSVTLHYDANIIDARMSYTIAARILSGDTVLFRTTSAYPVLTRDFPAQAELVLHKMPRTP